MFNIGRECSIFAVMVSVLFYVTLAKHSDRSPAQSIMEEYTKPLTQNLLRELDVSIKSKFTRRPILPRSRHRHVKHIFSRSKTSPFDNDRVPDYNDDPITTPSTRTLRIQPLFNKPSMPINLNSQLLNQLLLQNLNPYVNSPPQMPQYSLLQISPSSMPNMNSQFYMQVQDQNPVLQTPLVMNYALNAQEQIPQSYQAYNDYRTNDER